MGPVSGSDYSHTSPLRSGSLNGLRSIRFQGEKDVKTPADPALAEKMALEQLPGLLESITKGNGVEEKEYGEYARYVDNLANPKLKSNMMMALSLMKQLALFRKNYKSELHDKSIIKLCNQLSATLAAIPDKRFLILWMKALNTHGYNAMKHAALENTLLVEDEGLRNEFILSACESQYEPSRLLGVKLLPHLTQEKERLDLAEKLSRDGVRAVRVRASMLLGKKRIRHNLLGWYYFKSPRAKGSLQVQSSQSSQPVKKRTGNSELDQLRDRIQTVAMALHQQLKHQVQSNADLKHAVEGSRWLAVKAVPEADEMERRVTDIAEDYLRQTSSMIAKAYGVAVMPRESLELTLALLEVFYLAGMYDDRALTKENIPLFQGMYQQMQKNAKALRQTQQAYLQHVRAKDQMEATFKSEQMQLTQLKGQFDEAVKAQDNPTVTSLRQQLEYHKAILEQIEPTLKHHQESCQLAKEKMDVAGLKDRLERQRMMNVAQFKILSAVSKQLIDSDEQANPELDKLLAAAEDEMEIAAVDKHRQLDEKQSKNHLLYLLDREKAEDRQQSEKKEGTTTKPGSLEARR